MYCLSQDLHVAEYTTWEMSQGTLCWWSLHIQLLVVLEGIKLLLTILPTVVPDVVTSLMGRPDVRIALRIFLKTPYTNEGALFCNYNWN